MLKKIYLTLSIVLVLFAITSCGTNTNDVKVAEIAIAGVDNSKIVREVFYINSNATEMIYLDRYPSKRQYDTKAVLYDVVGDVLTPIIEIDNPSKFPTVMKYNDKNFYWNNSDGEVFSFNYEDKKINKLDVSDEIIYFEVSNDWMIFSSSQTEKIKICNLTNMETNDFSFPVHAMNLFWIPKFSEDIIPIFSQEDCRVVVYSPISNSILEEYEMPKDKIKNVLSITANDKYLIISCLINPEIYSECNTFLYDRRENRIVNISGGKNSEMMFSPKFITEGKFVFLSSTGSANLYDINSKKINSIKTLENETFDTIDRCTSGEVYVKNYGNGNVYMLSVDNQ